jgi:KDO2-lipid IV(A) lauroyltransferase
MKFFFLVIIYRSFAFLPLAVSRAFVRGLGRLVFALNLSHTKITRVNLRLCYPELSDADIEHLCKQRMLHLGQVFLETPRLWDSSPEWLKSKILSVEGLDLLEESLSDESGTIFICPHQGNWEILGPWITQYSKLTILYDPPRIESLGRWIKASRERSGATLVPANVRGVAALAKALKRGETTGILPDQQPAPESGIMVPFMGVPTLTMTLVTNLIKRSNSRALLVAALREPGGWKLHFLPVSEQLYSEDQVTAVTALSDDVARVVALAPAQYQWEYKRFRTQSDGRNIYAKDA